MSRFIINIIKKKILVGRLRAIAGVSQYTLRQWLFSPLTKIVGLNILTQEDVLKRRDKYQVLSFGSQETAIASEPSENIDEVPQVIKSHSGIINFSKPFVFQVANAQLIGSVAVGFDGAGNLISQTFPGIGNLKRYLPTRTLLFKSLPQLGVPQLDTAYSLINWRSRNYYHWITDCLIQLEALEYYQKQTGRKPKLVIQANPVSWQVESLRLLGYAPNDCIEWKVSRVKVKHLIVASARREQRTPSPAACLWLRERMLNNLPPTSSEKQNFASRIYISRPKAVGRKATNEDEVIATLTPYGFKEYILENLSFADQVRLFSQAEIVVATHGAGLVNMIFAQKLTVIELFDTFAAPNYFLLAKALGFHYECLTSGEKAQFQYSKKFNEVSVDIVKLQALVTKLLDTSNSGMLLKTVNQ
ncbi:glycosyltransferase family 61 protein [Gloeocapsopsis crepidinum LEGE 06123]|uniref:Glycosyltransferase family 61 protein n=1 Tax=Gloeocapsopsis crepidinum LEGE 06123 TaxID=588587 RepID=A0ABR9URT0_9CHRO|nr:glycosyltransferase family 61 protein [Gloeocapsopsis crepidinum]MBE9190995.1 glycosyltransferase family 61 protein [Gloeocapsopsis crepidinum LEGE 06123]